MKITTEENKLKFVENVTNLSEEKQEHYANLCDYAEHGQIETKDLILSVLNLEFEINHLQEQIEYQNKQIESLKLVCDTFAELI